MRRRDMRRAGFALPMSTGDSQSAARPPADAMPARSRARRWFVPLSLVAEALFAFPMAFLPLLLHHA